MMLLTRFWYAILGVALAASIAFLYIAIHEHNRLRQDDTYEIVNHDRDIVDWYLQLDARRRLDALGIVSIDTAVQQGLVKSNGAEKVDPAVREAMKKRLGELSQKLATLVRDEGKGGGGNPIMLFAIDGHGRVVGSVNFDRQNLVKDDTFELGGFPVVAEAMHGWLRDDTWVFDREAVYRVVARPVVAQAGAPPVGAVVALRRIDAPFAAIVAEKTNSPVAFYIDPPDNDGTVTVIATGLPPKSPVSWDGFTIDPKTLSGDKFYNDDKAGASSLKSEKDRSLIYSRMVGAGWELGAGYVVARKVAQIADPSALLAGADDSDKNAVPVKFIVPIALGGLLLGILFSWLEHSAPTNKLLREAERFRKGEQDAMPLGKLSGPYRKIGQDMNEGMERIIAKGGGTSRKAADLEQILGPVPTAPQMSAFSFNLSGDAPPASSPGSGPKGGGVDDLFPNLPPAQASPAVTAPMGAPPITSPKPVVAQRAAPPAPMIQQVSSQQSMSDGEDDEATMVARIPEELMKAATTGELHMIENADELVQWRQVFDDFVEMRKKCGESTTGLSFEKFQGQLRKNKEQLVRQYSCKRVKFTVYEKEGKAALKATPIKDS